MSFHSDTFLGTGTDKYDRRLNVAWSLFYDKHNINKEQNKREMIENEEADFWGRGCGGGEAEGGVKLIKMQCTCVPIPQSESDNSIQQTGTNYNK